MAYMTGNQSPYQSHSPFIPPSNLMGGGSPYGSPYRATTALPGGSPNMGAVPLPRPGTPNTPLNYGPYPQYGPTGWDPRPRRPSYHDPSSDGFIPSWLATPPNPGHTRRHSFCASGAWSSPGGGYAPYWPPPQTNIYPQNYGKPSPGFNIHPLLNGDSPSHNMLIFDLSAPKFSALKYLGPGHTEWISEAELAEPATWPGLNQLRIECDLVPQWPIIFDLDPSYFGGQLPPHGTQLPPITLGDVLVKTFDHFAQRISHVDWAALTHEDEVAIAKAYTARCKALGSAEAIERSQGVKRIDYCLGKVWFRGLTRVGDGIDVLKLHLQKR